MRLIHLTDLHLAPPPDWRSFRGRSQFGKRYLGYVSWWRRRRHSLREGWYLELVEAVQKTGADRILVTGDLTQTGTVEEIEAAVASLQQLGRPEEILLVPGNHDLYAAESAARAADAWAGYLHLEDAGYPVSWQHREVLVVGLCSAEPTPPLSATGQLGEDQCARFEALLAGHDARVKLVMLHHPPLPRMVQARKRLRDAATLQAILETQGADIVLHGHQHRNRMVTSRDLRVFCTGPASSEDASFRVFDIDTAAEAVRVSMTLWQRTAAGFQSVDALQWQVSARV